MKWISVSMPGEGRDYIVAVAFDRDGDGTVTARREFRHPASETAMLAEAIGAAFEPEEATAIIDAIRGHGGPGREQIDIAISADDSARRARAATVAALALAAPGWLGHVGGGYRKRCKGPQPHRKFPLPK
jgi:hypothetical protein